VFLGCPKFLAQFPTSFSTFSLDMSHNELQNAKEKCVILIVGFMVMTMTMTMMTCVVSCCLGRLGGGWWLLLWLWWLRLGWWLAKARGVEGDELGAGVDLARQTAQGLQ
jgi:hypothetical protein